MKIIKFLSIYCTLLLLSNINLYAQNDSIRENVLIYPEFPGGTGALLAFIAQELQKPMSNDFVLDPMTGALPPKGGKVIVNFIIDKTGKPTKLKLLESVGYIYDNHALRIVRRMPKWKPAMLNDEAIEFSYTLPINFINFNETVGSEMAVNGRTGDIYAWNMVDVPAKFSGGETAFDKYLKNCVKDIKADTYISFRFVIDRNGNVVNVKIDKGFSRDFDRAFVTDIYKMPRWQPAKNQGKTVSVERIVNLYLAK